MKYKVTLPPSNKKRLLKVKESKKLTIEFEVSRLEYVLEVDDDSNVILELFDLSNIKVFTALGTLPPPTPGEMNIGQANDSV